MARVKRGVVKHARKREVVKAAKGYYGRAGSCYRVAIEKVEKGMQYAYRDRKRRKRDFRKLWIQRLNAACREHGMVYSRFIDGLTKAGIKLDRKVLSDMAISEPESFKTIVEQAQKALEGKVNIKKAA